MGVVWCLEPMRRFGEDLASALEWPLLVGAPVEEGTDLVYVVGMHDGPLYQVTLELTKAATRRVFHWCGADAFSLTEPAVLPEALHLCDTEAIARELGARGVDASVVMTPTRRHHDVSPLPSEGKVAVYLGGAITGTASNEYDPQTVRAVMDLLPDVGFVTWRHGAFEDEALAQVFADSSVMLRLTAHDGGARTAREFMEAGRRVVTTERLPHARVVRRGDVVGILAATREALEASEPDAEAAGYWKAQNSVERYLADLERVGVSP